MTKLVTITGAASRLEISRYRAVKLVAAGVLPGPIAGTTLYHWPTIVAALNSAGMVQLLRPGARS